ncbi:hypothetical protein J3D56_001457 [Erwinia persicina]|uniref:Uncharacterized protein n=2 Tax=Erwinia TaxID=551 RepID=A0ABV4E763_9GAMM|nr:MULTISPECIES: hypothetical protein [Erwinia]MCP1438021.1 hypothetical protein [Erwinia persicina]MDN4626605.1 hypothetical protein [Erwinia sp. PsM31]
MKIQATLSDEFNPGSLDEPFSTDWIYLTPDEQRTIARFAIDIGEGRALKGKNKPSWVNDNYEKIAGSDGYEEQNYWHYHCGPTWYEETFKGLTVDLRFNPNGMASDECIHYIKKSDTQITIIGYSRRHIPFLASDWGENPFFSCEE